MVNLRKTDLSVEGGQHMKYYAVDSRYPSMLVRRIEAKDYELIHEFEKRFKDFSGILSSFSNYKIAQRNFDNFKLSIESLSAKIDLDHIQRSSVYPITVLIILTVTFINNAIYCKNKLSSERLTRELASISNKINFKTIRALRNHAIHASIPIKRNRRIHDLLNNEIKYEFYVQKNDILLGANKTDRKVLEEIKCQNIVVEELFRETEHELEFLMITILEEFVKAIPIDEKQSLVRNLKNYIDKDGKQISINRLIKSETVQHEKGITAKEYIHFDPVILEAIMSVIQNKDI